MGRDWLRVPRGPIESGDRRLKENEGLQSTVRSPQPLDAAALRDAIERHRAALVAQLARPPGGPAQPRRSDALADDGLALGRANARFLERCVIAQFEAAAARLGRGASGLALAAVGSCGRGAVALWSDADVVLVTPAVADDVAGSHAADASKFAEAMLYPLWDAGLPIGHQMLSAADAVALGRSDLATATALLDLRFLAGDEELVRALIAHAHEGLFGEEDMNAFFDRLEAEAAARHERFGGSVYLLEPDVKSGAGGLRDLDGARWAATARYGVGQGTTGETSFWSELVRAGVLVAREAQEIAASEGFLWRVRNRLHARARRKADRLGFEDQEVLGVAMGYGDDRARAAERLMQDYYLHARAVSRARAGLLERLRPVRRRGKPSPPTDLGGDVQLFEGQITISHTAALQQDPALAMRVFAGCVRHQAPVLGFARDAIIRSAADPEWCERLRASREAAELFVDLVCTVQETCTGRRSMVGELHEVGLLLAMVPEFLPVTGRVHHDVYHVYTVDVHSVAAVDRLRQLARGELAHEFPLASRIAAEIARRSTLFLATLLHDVGKGWPDENGSLRQHSKVGAEMCARILPRLGLSPEDTDEACQLVFDHLLMYRIATRRDLDDVATIAEFCRNVRGHEGLRDLYLLTVADLSTTSPTAMTSWKARMLDELYFAAEAYLSGEQPRADVERGARIREAVRGGWTGDAAALDALLASMPERYLLANVPESIAQHARVVLERGERAAHVGRVHSRHPEAAELCVVADDRPGLLASIAAAITANRLEVLAAQVYSRTAPASNGRAERVEAVDIFWVRDRDGGTEGVELALPRLARDLDDMCAGRVAADELIRSRSGSSSPWRERPSPAVPTEILLDDRASPRHTIVEVFAKDRPGLLYRLAHALHELGLSISLSKINTEGTRVADVFYVNELDGSKIVRGARYKEVQDSLVRAVGG
jgi:[protein-PII] uridylyltransferase